MTVNNAKKIILFNLALGEIFQNRIKSVYRKWNTTKQLAQNALCIN